MQVLIIIILIIKTSSPAFLDILVTLGTTISFSSLLRLGFTMSQLCLTNCLLCLITVAFVSYILTILCMLSFILTIAIYIMPFPPLRPIKGVRGIYLFSLFNTKGQAGCIYIYTGCRKRTLYLYAVTATNLVLPRANTETSHSMRIGLSGNCRR